MYSSFEIAKENQSLRFLYNKTESYEKFYTLLKKFDQEYRTTLITFSKI